MNQQANDAVDVEALRELYKTDVCARALLDYAASRTRNSNESSVDRLLALLNKGESNFARSELIRSLKQLAISGAGDFVIGRRGQPSRFQWAVAMIGVGKAARGEDDVMIESLDDIYADEHVDGDDEEQIELAHVAEGAVRHLYKLRTDFEVRLDLPEDLSTKEAARLSAFILTLPFDI